MLRRTLIALALVALPAAVIAQSWPNLPIIGGNSYCSSTVNSSCVNTVPAGPAMTGSETVPADTNFNSGASGVQTAKVPITAIGGGLTTVAVPVTTDTLTVTAQTKQLIVNPAGTIAALTVNMPAATTALYTGQKIGICGTQIVTTLTMGAGTGNTFSTTAPTAMLVPVVTGAASCFEFIYVRTSATVGVWHRTQ